jgi:D-alanine-D-alanine ligase
MSAIPVGVLRGGRGTEYEVSLATGEAILAALPTDRYKAYDVLITRDGRWHLGGLPTTPERVARVIAVAVNALHGEFGEDGKVQNLLESLGLPYTGSGTFAAAISFNKPLANELFRRAGLRVAPGVALRAVEAPGAAGQVFRQIGPPWIIKPAAGGSSIGIRFARTLPELAQVLEAVGPEEGDILVERYVGGREATCGVVEDWRGQEHYALPAIEIRRPSGRHWWTYEDKYSGATEEVCPGCFNAAEKRQLAELAVRAHQALGLRHYSRSDFIVTPRGIYLLEINSLPGLTRESLLPKSLAAVGASLPEFLDHLIQLALK